MRLHPAFSHPKVGTVRGRGIIPEEDDVRTTIMALGLLLSVSGGLAISPARAAEPPAPAPYGPQSMGPMRGMRGGMQGMGSMRGMQGMQGMGCPMMVGSEGTQGQLPCQDGSCAQGGHGEGRMGRMQGMQGMGSMRGMRGMGCPMRGGMGGRQDR